MRSLKFVFKEHKENLYKIMKLSVYDFITPLRDTYLGVIWILLNPLTQIGVYWFVFGIGIRGGKPVDGHPFLLWMLAGLVPWFYISSAISGGALCIYSKASILTKMRFPTSIIPTYSTLTQLLNNIPVIITTMIIFAFYGYKGTIFYVQTIYYIFAATVLLIGLALLNSALVVAIRDVNRLIGTVLRFLFYLTPILWTVEKMPIAFQKILKLNPFIYIIDGFRDSMLYNQWFYTDMKGTIYYWTFTLIVLLLGVVVHMRLRDKFSDMV